MTKLDYRFQNKALLIHLALLTITAFIVAFTPIYTVYVTNPNTKGVSLEEISPYHLNCYAFRATIPNTDCYTGTSFKACYNILDDINRGHCEENKLVVGSENLEQYSIYTSVASTSYHRLPVCSGFLSLLLIAGPSSRKNDFHKVAAFFHFIAAIAALVLADTVVSTINETRMEYTNGIGQTPLTGTALYIICILPLLELIVDNFHPELV